MFLFSDEEITNLNLHITYVMAVCSFVFQMKDCNVVASKLILILDDLLWVLTDSQLKAMVQYAKSLSEAMEKSAAQRKTMAPDTTQVCVLGHVLIPSPINHTTCLIFFFFFLLLLSE